VWVGFDNHNTLGPHEEGAKVALPIWMSFMGDVLKEKPVEDFPHSPLLTSPDQVKEILESGGTERLMAGQAVRAGETGQPLRDSLAVEPRPVSHNPDSTHSGTGRQNRPTPPADAAPAREGAPAVAKPAPTLPDAKPAEKTAPTGAAQ